MSLAGAIDRLMAHERVLVGVDFDGTLAPIVEHPDLAVADPRALDLLSRIAEKPAVRVAIVSGRGLTDLKARLGDVPGATFVGEHGNDVEGEQIEPSPALIEARSLVEGISARFPEATVEEKQHSVTFHTRSLEAADAESARRQIREWVTGRQGIDLIEGKEVYELTTAVGTKGDAIKELAGDSPIIYLGDDTTDETVFEVLGPEDVGIKVGDGPTAATYRVEDIDGVVTILDQILLASR